MITPAFAVEVDAMRQAEAVSLLASGLEMAGNRSKCEQLAARLGEWPLLINLVNGQLILRVKEHGQSFTQALGSVETLEVWELATGKAAITFTAYAGLVCCAICGDGATIVCSSGAGRVHILGVEGKTDW